VASHEAGCYGYSVLKLWQLAAGALLVAALLGACGEEDTESEPGPRLDLTVGNSIPLTGALDAFGRSGKKAAEAGAGVVQQAIDELEGRQRISLAFTDNGGGEDPEKAVEGARELIEEDAADCIVGAWATTDTREIAVEAAIPAEIPLISPAAPGDELTELDDEGLVSRTSAPDRYQGPTLAMAVADDLGAAEDAAVNVAARDDAYGAAIADGFVAKWKELGGEIGHDVRYRPGAPIPEATAKEIVADEPQALVIVDFPESFGLLAEPLAATGSYDPAITWSTDGLAVGDLPADAIDGLRGTVPGTPDADESTQAFFELYEEAAPTGVEPQTFDAHVFDAVVLCFLAAYAAGGDEGQRLAEQLDRVSGPPGEPFTWGELPDAMRALAAGRGIDYQGASGGIDLDPQGDPTTGTYDIYRYDGEELKIVDEVPLTTD